MLLRLGILMVVPGSSMATLPGFPDIGDFQSVDSALYLTHFGRGGRGVFFSAPDGLQCGWGSLADGPEDHISVGRAGPLTGLPDTASRGGTAARWPELQAH